ncbi:MAG: hypothetical protein K2H49_05230, partial [Muribaculaceae bacterium]|nr:hypothetical protein [Muribaculaceae bacterium]
SNNMEDKAEHIVNKKNIGQGSLMVAADAIKKESEEEKEKIEISKSEHEHSYLTEDASSYPNETSTDLRENFFAVSDEFEDFSCGVRKANIVKIRYDIAVTGTTDDKVIRENEYIYESI